MRNIRSLLGLSTMLTLSQFIGCGIDFGDPHHGRSEYRETQARRPPRPAPREGFQHPADDARRDPQAAPLDMRYVDRNPDGLPEQ